MSSLSMKGAAGVSRAVAVVCRVIAWGLVALVVVDAFMIGPARAALLGINGVVQRTIPSALSGLLVFQTPFGGVFRGDFAIAAILLLVADWALRRLSRRL